MKIVVKATGGTTPYSSITASPDVSGERAEAVSSASPLASVVKQCRERDGYRCVISNIHDFGEGKTRISKAKTKGTIPVDVDGEPLGQTEYEKLIVAHITPWSLGNMAVRRLYYL